MRRSQPAAKQSASIQFAPRSIRLLCILLIGAFFPLCTSFVAAQCVGTISDLSTAATCTAKTAAPKALATIDPQRRYRLEELIDIAETNNPRTRIAWERAKQAAEGVGIARSEYFPRLAGTALFGNERFINPFPKPLAPLGYTMVESPTIDAGLAVEYTVFDFGRRRAQLDSSLAQRLAAVAGFQRVNQDVAYDVVVAYYNLVTAQEKLAAIQQILATARTTQSAAEAQLANGRATLPDVLNAKAGTARAEYDLQTSLGAEEIARVKLCEALGVEPSDAIRVEKPAGAPDLSAVSTSVSSFVETALQDRPDLKSLAERLRAADAEVKATRSAYRPTVAFESEGSSQSIWPAVSQPSLGDTTQFVWSTGVELKWNLFDGGLRRHEVLRRASEQRQAAEELREKSDDIVRETWVAYLQFGTAVRQQEAARTLLLAATTSYDASLDAYGYGVKNLIDLVNAESQLAEARLADVEARSAVLTSAANLGYTTGNLLRPRSDGAQSVTTQP
jgi:outer membrane protein TolC